MLGRLRICGGLLLLLALLLGLAQPFAAQGWRQWTYGLHDWPQGTFVDTAVTRQGGEWGLGLVRRPHLLRERDLPELGGPARGIALDSRGEALVVGYAGEPHRFVTVRLSADGTVIWRRSDGLGSPSRALDVAVDSRDNVLVAGTTWLGGYDYDLVKYDPQGRPLWERLYSGGRNDRAQAVAVDAQDRVTVTGYSALRDADVLTLQYTPEGAVRWARRYDGGSGDWGLGIAVDRAGRVFVAGSTTIAGQRDVLLLKYDAQGRLLWVRTYDTGYEDVGAAVAVNAAGEVAVAGYTGLDGGRDYLVLVYDDRGALRWARSQDGGGDGDGDGDGDGEDRAFGVTWDAQGNLWVTGGSALDGREAFYTVKYDPFGNVLWTRADRDRDRDRGSSEIEMETRAYDLEADAQGRIWVVGREGSSGRLLQYADGFLPRGEYRSPVHDFGQRVTWQALEVDAHLAGESVSVEVTVEVSDDGFRSVADAVRLVLREGKGYYYYPLRGLQRARYARVQLALSTESWRTTPLIKGFRLLARTT